MKLINCIVCADIIRLVPHAWRSCECNRSGGQYLPNLDGSKPENDAVIYGPCAPMGISNPSFDIGRWALCSFGSFFYGWEVRHGGTIYKARIVGIIDRDLLELWDPADQLKFYRKEAELHETGLTPMDAWLQAHEFVWPSK